MVGQRHPHKNAARTSGVFHCVGTTRLTMSCDQIDESDPVKDLGCTTNIEVVNQFVSLDGQYVIDAGCGSLTFTRLLAEHALRVLAVDPDPIQAEQNRRTQLEDNIEFVETGADTLPAKNQTVDGVFFAYSLHHIPADLYSDVFAEVRRVLKPDGFMVVIEPLDCPLNQVMKLFHNEDREREAAWRALENLAAPAFRSGTTATYHNYAEYKSWDHFADHFANRSFNTLYADADVRNPAVQKAFEKHGGPNRRFQSPKRIMVLKGLK